MTIKELKDKSAKELDKMLAEFRDKLRSRRFRVAAKQQTDVREIREIRRTIARIMTLRSADKKSTGAAS